jgi:hypothetical protein
MTFRGLTALPTFYEIVLDAPKSIKGAIIECAQNNPRIVGN